MIPGGEKIRAALSQAWDLGAEQVIADHNDQQRALPDVRDFRAKCRREDVEELIIELARDMGEDFKEQAGIE